MTQTPPSAPRTAAPRRKKSGRRRSRQQGVSPFVIMGIVGAIVIIALVAFSVLNNRPVTYDNVPRSGTTLGYPDAPVTITEFGDFQ